MVEIIPSILTNSPEEFKEMMRLSESHFSSVHLDIADGVFVPNITIEGINEFKKINTKLKTTVHLMVSTPENIVEGWLNTEAEGLIFHIESTNQIDRLIKLTKSKRKRVGMAINPETPLEKLSPFLEQIDFVHFLTVDPGFYGSEFKVEVLDKIRSFRENHDKIEIRVDGGINVNTAKKVVDVGADVLIIGSYFFKQSHDIKDAIENIKRAIYT